jgi:hypothetical protein
MPEQALIAILTASQANGTARSGYIVNLELAQLDKWL